MSGRDRSAPGVVHVRLTGVPADTTALAAVLAGTPGVQILTGPDGPYPSRRQPGHRFHLTVRLTQPPITNAPTARMEGNPMTTEPTYDASNVHLAQGQTADSMQFLTTEHTGPGAAGPDAPIPYTLTPQAGAYLDGLNGELSPAGPEPEASL